MSNQEVQFFTATGVPYIPKIIPVSKQGFRRLYRWRPQLDDLSTETASSTEFNSHASISLRLSREHRRREFTSLVHQSGWASFELLSISTLPRLDYLLYSAVTYLGDWVQGLVLESLFDSVESVKMVDPPAADIVGRLRCGVECHRQLSLVHWQQRRKRLLNELEAELAVRYGGKTDKIESRLKDSRRRLAAEQSAESRRRLSEDRNTLRQALLKAEMTEDESANFILRLHSELPQFELQNLFTVEWTVKPARPLPKKSKKER